MAAWLVTEAAFQTKKHCLRSKAVKAVCIRVKAKRMTNGWDDNLQIIDPAQTVSGSIVAIVTDMISAGLPISVWFAGTRLGAS